MDEWDLPSAVASPCERGGQAAGATDGDSLTLTGPHAQGYGDHARPAKEADNDRTVHVEWALWGKEDDEPGYRVLRCSKGTFTREDFHGIISRYASGTKGTLPQYTICWVPEEHGHQGYLAVGIHEHADEDPSRAGGRARTSGGRLVEYVRLFCVPYDDLAKRRASYTELVAAVWHQQLPAGRTERIPVSLPEIVSPVLPAPLGALAENVAALLLTTRPVCVLAAEATSGVQRLRFIDQVVALLPYGLRTTLSASTSASATAQNLKLRLFFSSAEVADSGRTTYVAWGEPAEPDLSAAQDMSARMYLNWLRHVGAGTAVDTLADQTAPARFRSAEIRGMVASLPVDRPVTDILEQLADGLRRGDTAVVSPMVTRLRRYLERGAPDPVVRLACQEQIIRLGLLGSHSGVRFNTEASVYRVLLRLAFEGPLTYEGYCWIEDAVDGPPRGRLRQEIFTQFKFAGFLPWLLTCIAEPEFTDEDLMARLHSQRTPATAPVTELLRCVTTMRAQHRAAAYDFAVRYLRAYARDPRTDLVRLGFLAGTVEDAFPGNRLAQRRRLQETISFVYNGWPASDQISELDTQPGVRHTRVLDELLTNPPGVMAADEEESVWAYLRRTVNAGVVVGGLMLITILAVLAILYALYHSSRG